MKNKLHISRLLSAVILFTAALFCTGCDDVADIRIANDMVIVDSGVEFDYESFFEQLCRESESETTISEETIETFVVETDSEATELAEAVAADTDFETSAPVEIIETANADSEMAVIVETSSESAVTTVAVSDAESALLIDTDRVTVYWTKNGEVWHATKKCPSLSRSKDICSGDIDSAMTSGKTRACKRCS